MAEVIVIMELAQWVTKQLAFYLKLASFIVQKAALSNLLKEHLECLWRG